MIVIEFFRNRVRKGVLLYVCVGSFKIIQQGISYTEGHVGINLLSPVNNTSVLPLQYYILLVCVVSSSLAVCVCGWFADYYY